MSDALHARILEYLQTQRGMVFAAAPNGSQIASTTCYTVDDELNLYGFVFKDSDKHAAIAAGSPLAFVIDEGFRIPMHGVEYHGTGAFIEDDTAIGQAQERLAEKYPRLSNVWGHPAVVLFRAQPERITLIDWSVRLGHSETLTFDAAPA